MPNDYDNRGQVALWKPNSDNERAPAAKGTVVAHRDIKEGETVEIALWKNDSENARAPVMKGKISDKREQGSQPSSEGQDDEFDSDVPF